MLKKPIKVGDCFDFPSGISRRVIGLDPNMPMRIRLEFLSGRRVGLRYWENIGWVIAEAVPSTTYN